MKIKSNSHALEILRDLVDQGYLKEDWMYGRENSIDTAIKFYVFVRKT